MRSGPRRSLLPQDRPEDRMLDLLYLAIGVGVFALFAAYAVALRRI
jgi:hypothetical protein